MSSNMSQASAACDAAFRCNNCKANFSCIETIKEHYKSDWHVLNSKRRAQNLLPLSREEFKKVKGTLPQKKPAAPSSSGATSASSPAKQASSLPAAFAGQSKVAVAPPVPPADDVAVFAANDNGQEETEETEVFEELEVDPLVSLFDNAKFDSIEECIKYMGNTYGFYIPDAKYVTDLSELLDYLGSKVKTGGMCLFCHRQFRSAYACQSHMKDAGHCKVAYEEDDDVEELEDFYDYFEDEDEVGDEDDEDMGEAHVSSIGELVLPDGRTVGHRAFKIYYKQRHRPVDDRPSILAVEREEIVRLGGMFGGNKVSNEELIKMSEGELRSLVMKYQKEERKGHIAEQRGRLRRMMLDQKRENRSIIHKTRSSETTTAKIRDYHKTVM